MSGLAEIAAAMMRGAEQRIAVTADNVSNLNTPGYQVRRVFSEVLDLRAGLPSSRISLERSVSLAPLQATGAPFDFATDADSRLALRGPDGVIFSRSAQLRRDDAGRLVDGRGLALQATDDGDLVVSGNVATVRGDGMVLVDGQPEGRIAMYTVASIAAGRPELAESGEVQQGVVAVSDVNLGDEMLELGRAGRLAEAGARLFQLQDDLLAKGASQLGSIAR